MQDHVQFPQPPEGQRIAEESAALVTAFAIVAQVPGSTPSIESIVDVLQSDGIVQ